MSDIEVKIHELTGHTMMSRRGLEEAREDFAAIMGHSFDEWIDKQLSEVIEMTHLCPPPLKPDHPANLVTSRELEFTVPWRRRMVAIQEAVESRNGCTITIAPIGQPEPHDDGVFTWKYGTIKVMTA